MVREEWEPHSVGEKASIDSKVRDGDGTFHAALVSSLPALPMSTSFLLLLALLFSTCSPYLLPVPATTRVLSFIPHPSPGSISCAQSLTGRLSLAARPLRTALHSTPQDFFDPELYTDSAYAVISNLPKSAEKHRCQTVTTLSLLDSIVNEYSVSTEVRERRRATSETWRRTRASDEQAGRCTQGSLASSLSSCIYIIPVAAISSC